MIITRKKLEGLVADLDKIFPKPDPNAKIEDAIGCFEDMIPKDKSGVEMIREERARMFDLSPDNTDD